MGKDGRDAVRLTTTLTRSQYEKLDELAKENQVKLAWLVRYATQKLLKESEEGTLQLDFGWRREDA